LNARGRQHTDPTHVLGAVRSLNRLECVTETLRAVLNALACAAPEWLRRHADPAWAERYGRRANDRDVPQGEAKRRAHAEQIGRDGHQWLCRKPFVSEFQLLLSGFRDGGYYVQGQAF
jgi:hypothetical protein